MFDMILPPCSRDEKGAWHYVWSDLGVSEQDFDEIDMLLAREGGNMDMYTETGILVFDMGG